jgi:hypothetical protein
MTSSSFGPVPKVGVTLLPEVAETNIVGATLSRKSAAMRRAEAEGRMLSLQ